MLNNFFCVLKTKPVSLTVTPCFQFFCEDAAILLPLLVISLEDRWELLNLMGKFSPDLTPEHAFIVISN